MAEKNEKFFFRLNIYDGRDEKALWKMLDLVFHYAMHTGKEGIDILNLIAKNEYENLLYEYMISSKGNAQAKGIFTTAVEYNCIDLIKFFIKIKLEMSPYSKELIKLAERCKYFEMSKLLKEYFQEIE